MERFVACVAALLLIVVSASGVQARDTEAPQNALLLVAFGTTVPEAQKALDQVDKQARAAFQGTEICWAYTSKKVRAKLRKQGKKLDSPAAALVKLIEDGYTRIVIASFHTLPGVEFHELAQDVTALRGMAEASHCTLLLSRPLLSSRENMLAVTRGLLKGIPAQRKPTDAVVLMGHGSEHHPGDAVYAALNYYLLDVDTNVFVGTVEGNPTLKDIIPKLKSRGVKKVFLVPFMAVAGDHARNDLCGSEQDSWKSILTASGFDVECVLKGTAENPEIVRVWLNNIKQAQAH